MKKKFAFLLGCLLTTTTFVGCDKRNDPVSPINYRATFETNGGTPIESYLVSTINKSPITTKEGFIFDNWCLDSLLTEAVVFPYTLTKDTTFYAKWHEQLPKGTLVGSATYGVHTAKEYITASYGKSSLDLRVIVEDDVIFNSYPSIQGILNGMNDNVEITFCPVTKQSSGRIEQKTYKFMYVPGIGYEVRQFVNGDYSNPLYRKVVTVTDEKIYTLGKDAFAGYGFKISIPYDFLELTEISAKENIALAFSMRNTIGPGDQTTYRESEYLGSWLEHAWTYLIVDGSTNSLKRREVTGVIFGDSYTNPTFMNTVNNDFAEYDFYTTGISGSKLVDWINLQNRWYERVTNSSPKHIFVHLGVNDIQSGATADTAFNNFKTLIDILHTYSPNSKIHFLVVPENFFDPINLGKPNRYNEVIVEYDDKIIEYAINIEYLDLIRLDQMVNGEYTSFCDDGLHPNEFVYAKLNKAICEICGFNKQYENKTFGNSNEMVSSGQIVYDESSIYSPGYGQTFAWIKQSGNDSKFEAIISMKIGEIRNNDEWPKFGIVLKHSNDILFNYVDITLGKHMGVVNFHHWDENRTTPPETFPWGARWDWNAMVVGDTEVNELPDYKNQYVTFRIVKDNTNISIYINDAMTPSIIYDDVFLNSNVNVGVMSFNAEYFVKNATYSTLK